MLSGYSRKIDNHTSAVTIDARKIMKTIEDSQQSEHEILPHQTQLIVSKQYFTEFGLLHEQYLNAQEHNIILTNSKEVSEDGTNIILTDILSEKITIEKNADNAHYTKFKNIRFLDYSKEYCLESDFTVDEDELLVLQQNVLVLNGHTLHIKGAVDLHGKCVICNGHISVETCDSTKDVFSTRIYYINGNPLYEQEAQVEFNCVDVKCIDDGSSTTFLNKKLGFPQTEDELKDPTITTGFKILYDSCFSENDLFQGKLKVITAWEQRLSIIGLFLLKVNKTPEETLAAIKKSADAIIQNESYGKSFEPIIYTFDEEGNREESLVVKTLLNIMFSEQFKDIFRPVPELITELNGSVSRFNNFVKFLCKSTFKMSYSTYYDYLQYNVGVADDVHLYGYHDFITDRYLPVGEKSSAVTIEHCLYVTRGFTDTNQGSTIFDLNNKLDVKDTQFILYGVYEFISNNFLEDSEKTIYHTKTFEDCEIDMFKSDNFLTINGGNVLFRNCKIHFYKPVLESSRFITFRRYASEFNKKIRVHFENCEILGNSVAGDDETYNEDYCKIVIHPSISATKLAELYINSDDVIKSTINQEFTDIDRTLSVSEKSCYIRARQMNIFESGTLIES